MHIAHLDEIIYQCFMSDHKINHLLFTRNLTVRYIRTYAPCFLFLYDKKSEILTHISHFLTKLEHPKST